MFWDAVLNSLRALLSNDVRKWMVGSMLVAFIMTKAYVMVSGRELGGREQANFALTVFLLLVGLFYLP